MKKRILSSILCLLVCLFPLSSSAAPAGAGSELLDSSVPSATPRRITGSITFFTNGSPNIEVELWKDAVKVGSAKTDESGGFKFNDLEPGVYTIKMPETVSFTAYTSQPIDLTTSESYSFSLNRVTIWKPQATVEYDSTDEALKLHFSREMAPGTEYNIAVKSGDSNISGNWYLHPDTSTYTFYPIDPFTPGSTVTIALPGSLKTVSGLSLGEDKTMTVQIPNGTPGTGTVSSDTPPTSTDGSTLYFSYPLKDSVEVTLTLKNIKNKTLIIQPAGDARLIVSPKVIADMLARRHKKLTFSVQNRSLITEIRTGIRAGSIDTPPTSTGYNTLNFFYPEQNSAEITFTPANIKDKTLFIRIADSSSFVLPAKSIENYADMGIGKITLRVKKGGFIVNITPESDYAGQFRGLVSPLKIELPIASKSGESQNMYLPVRSTDDTYNFITKSAVSGSKVVFETSQTGTFYLKYTGKSFKDVPSGAWYEGAAKFAASRELFSGMGINNFAPDIGMTRGMFATVLAKLDGASLLKYDVSIYSDVAITDYYGRAVAWAADKGIIGGYGNGIFGPNDKITREQMAVILSNYIKYKGYVLPKNTSAAPFADQAKINSWALAFVQEIRDTGLISGKSGNRYDPQGTATRAEVAAVFKKFMEVYLSA